MANLIETIEITKWLELNAKLQQKKNVLRVKLTALGVLQKGKVNTFDHYKYFSEAQYKELFTRLFGECKLELKHDELAYDFFDGVGNQPNGRLVRLLFTLFDVETGFYEETVISGEALDKGDKAGYKAYTGALKYYLADTFMVATGDDPENESPEGKTSDKKNNVIKGNNPNEIVLPTAAQLAELQSLGVTLKDVAVYNKTVEGKVTADMVTTAINRKKKAQPTGSNYQRIKSLIGNAMSMDDVSDIAAEIAPDKKRINDLTSDEMDKLVAAINDQLGGGDNE